MNWTGGPLSRTRPTAHGGREGPPSARQRQHFARARMKSNTRGRVPQDDIGYQSHSSDNEENARFHSLPHLPWRGRKREVSVGQSPRESYQSDWNSSVRKGPMMKADFVDTAATVIELDDKVHKRGNRHWVVDERTHDLANSRAGTSLQARSLVIDSNLAAPVDGYGAQSRLEDRQSPLSAFENARRLLLAREDWASTSLLHPPHFNFPGSDQRNIGRRRRVTRLPSYLARCVTRRSAQYDYELFYRDRRDRRSREKCRIKIGDSTPVDERGQKLPRTQEAAMEVEEVPRNARVGKSYERLSEKGLEALLREQRASSIDRNDCDTERRRRDIDQRTFDLMNHRKSGLESHHIVKLVQSNLDQAAVRRSRSLDRPIAELVSLDILRKTTSSFPTMIDSSSRHCNSLEEDHQSRLSCPHLDIGDEFHDQSATVESIASEPPLPTNYIGQQEFERSPKSIKPRSGHSPAHGSSSSGFSELQMAIYSPPLFISRRDRRSPGDSNIANEEDNQVEVLGQDGIGLVESMPNRTQHVSLVSEQAMGGSRFCCQSDCMATVVGPTPVNISTDIQETQGPSANMSEDGAWRRLGFDKIVYGDSLCTSFQLESTREFSQTSDRETKELEFAALLPHYSISSLAADVDKCEKRFSYSQDKSAISSGLSTPMPHTQRPPTSPLKSQHQRIVLLETAGDSTYLDNLLIGIGTLGQANETTPHAPFGAFGAFGGSGFTASNDAPVPKQRGSSTTKASVVINRGTKATRQPRAPLRMKNASKSTEKIGPIQEALRKITKQTEDAEKPPSKWLFIRPPPFLAATSLAPRSSIRTQNHRPMTKTCVSNPRASRGCSPRQKAGNVKVSARNFLTSVISRGDGWGNGGPGSREGWGMDEGVEGIDDD